MFSYVILPCFVLVVKRRPGHLAGSICELRGCQRFARNVMVSPLLVGDDTWVPQNPHLTASGLIGSAQLGASFGRSTVKRFCLTDLSDG